MVDAQKPKQSAESLAREKRLKEKLRVNLHRRKQKARALKSEVKNEEAGKNANS